MKNISYRSWLVFLGIAVAIIVTLTTAFWAAPPPLGDTQKSGNSTDKKSLIPKIGEEVFHYLKQVATPSSLRGK